MGKSKITKVKWSGKTVDEWEAQRAIMEGYGDMSITRIGASDVSVVTGSNSYKCPQRLYHHLTGFKKGFFITESTLAGHLAEPTMQSRWESWCHDEYERLMNVRNNVKLRKIKKAGFFLLNSKYSQLFASIDFVPVGKTYSPFTGELYHPLTPHECKNTKSSYYKTWTGGITQAYKEQVHAQMMLSNTKVAVFMVYVDGSEFKVMEIERDEELCKFIDEKTRLFEVKCLIGKIHLDNARNAKSEREYQEHMAQFEENAPPVVGMTDNTDLLNELWPESNTLTMMGDEIDEHRCYLYTKATSLEAKLKTLKIEVKNQMKEKMKDFAWLETESYKVSNQRGRSDKKDHFGIKVKQS